jgi:hypothetical protein
VSSADCRSAAFGCGGSIPSLPTRFRDNELPEAKFEAARPASAFLCWERWVSSRADDAPDAMTGGRVGHRRGELEVEPASCPSWSRGMVYVDALDDPARFAGHGTVASECSRTIPSYLSLRLRFLGPVFMRVAVFFLSAPPLFGRVVFFRPGLFRGVGRPMLFPAVVCLRPPPRGRVAFMLSLPLVPFDMGLGAGGGVPGSGDGQIDGR